MKKTVCIAKIEFVPPGIEANGYIYKSFWSMPEQVHYTNWRWRTFGQKIKFAARLFEATNYSACAQTRRYA